MVTAVLSPHDSSGQRKFTLPDCAPGILAMLEKAAVAVDAAQEVSQGKLRLTFNLCGKSGKLEVATFVE